MRLVQSDPIRRGRAQGPGKSPGVCRWTAVRVGGTRRIRGQRGLSPWAEPPTATEEEGRSKNKARQEQRGQAEK